MSAEPTRERVEETRGRRPWRRCSACWGVCYWHDEAWVCNDTECGAEFYPEHGRRFAAPEDSRR